MKIIISQQNKKLSIKFRQGRFVDNYAIGRADEFLAALDKFLKKRKLNADFLKKAELEFSGTGLLTERVVRSIIAGLSFNTA